MAEMGSNAASALSLAVRVRCCVGTSLEWLGAVKPPYPCERSIIAVAELSGWQSNYPNCTKVRATVVVEYAAFYLFVPLCPTLHHFVPHYNEISFQCLVPTSQRLGYLGYNITIFLTKCDTLERQEPQVCDVNSQHVEHLASGRPKQAPRLI